jgi:hypothetical protein
MEIPKAISLWSSAGDHAGFMLLAPDSSNSAGTCVFMLSPSSIAGIESEMGVIVSELREMGEHTFRLNSEGSRCELVVSVSGFPDIIFSVDDGFSGKAFTEIDGAAKCVGSFGPICGNA